MSDAIIEVSDLSKRYIIGHHKEKGDDGLRHMLERAARAPARWLRSGRPRFGRASQEEFWALKDVSFDVRAGEVVGIIGRNGAGKSTLLKILSRITEPAGGRVRLRGRVASLLEVGTGFHPELTGRENIFLNGAILGMPRLEIKRKFDEIIDFAGVAKFLDTPVKRYSSGMYVRLAFAVAAHLEPEILVVDEVLAVGDADFQKKCLGKMEEVAATSGRTILFVSHNMAAIQNLCKRCILLEQGSLLEDGETSDVVNSYLSTASSRASSIPLSERKDRKGDGRVRVREIAFLDTSGERVRDAVSGMTLVIRVFFAVEEEDAVRNCRISLGIAREVLPYFILSTDLVDKTPLHLSGEGYVDFVVPDLPLSGGAYLIGTFIGSDGDRVTQDWVQDAATINVEDGDFFGSGKLYHPGYQGKSVLVKHQCRIEMNRDAQTPPSEKIDPVPEDVCAAGTDSGRRRGEATGNPG